MLPSVLPHMNGPDDLNKLKSMMVRAPLHPMLAERSSLRSLLQYACVVRQPGCTKREPVWVGAAAGSAGISCLTG